MAEETDIEETKSGAALPAATAGSGGYVWCWMCGYNARLTAVQRYHLEHGHDTHCDDCAGVGDDSILEFGDELPDDFIEDDPMLLHRSGTCAGCGGYDPELDDGGLCAACDGQN